MQCAKVENTLWEYLAGELNPRRTSVVREHLRVCKSCRRSAQSLQKLVRVVRGAHRAAPSDQLCLRVKYSMTGRTEREFNGAVFGEILDVPGLAGYLKLEESDITANLDQIPHFEIAGKIRFKKSVVDSWMESRQRRYWKPTVAGGVIRITG